LGDVDAEGGGVVDTVLEVRDADRGDWQGER
jgi:hypothetical protein